MQFIHLRWFDKKTGNLLPKGGVTATYSLVYDNSTTSVFANIAVAKCQDVDVFCKRLGREKALERYHRGSTWSVLLGTAERLQAETVSTPEGQCVRIKNTMFDLYGALEKHILHIVKVRMPEQSKNRTPAPKDVPEKDSRLNAATVDSIIDLVRKELLLLPDAIIAHTSVLNDLFTDSLDRVELMMAVEDHFSIHVSDQESENLSTVGDLIELIAKNRQ